MTAKQKVLRALKGLPERASVEDAIERLYLLYKIERGLAQAKAGKVLSHAEVRRRMSRWLK
ncbi:MAG: hypothetical protein L0216_19070 [Planctomycetales bacterium]|nr:hypothetical protein [Planctomycetales bacterium]